MRQIFAAAALAFAVATPAFVTPALAQTTHPYTDAYGNHLSGDSDVRYRQQWDRIVAQANANRLNEEAQDQAVTQHAAAGNPVSTTDAAFGRPASQAAATPSASAAPGRCRAIDPNWQFGDYCVYNER